MALVKARLQEGHCSNSNSSGFQDMPSLPGTISLVCLQALQEIVARGADPANIRVIAVVAAPPALKLMADTYPGAQNC
jgi:hypothetical protein